MLDMDICAQIKDHQRSSKNFTSKRTVTSMKRVYVQYLSHPIKPAAQWILGTHTKVLIKCCQMFLIEKTQTHTCLHTAQ